MSISKDRLHFLLQRHIAGTLSEQEMLELKHFDDTDIHRALNELLDRTNHGNLVDIPDDAIPSEKLYREILGHPHVLGPRAEAALRSSSFHGRYIWWSAGVAALLCIGILLFRGHYIADAPASDTALATTSILPGGNKATLTLADGSALALNETQGSIIIDDNHITYGDGTPLIGEQQMGEYLELTIPRGGTYHVTLADGTEVWLNADSRFRYPSRFTGDQRVVELDGEAFFAVAKQQRQHGRGNIPFLVKTKFQTIEVLGTEFNVSAYGDEAAEHTTLVEGSVQIIANSGTTQQLYPNQQGIVTSSHTHIKTVDIDNFTAWKDGYFAFSDTHIRDVMQVIARWYDIQVDYADETLDARFGGTISRFSDFETLLQTIALTGSVRFKITGRRVTVMT